MKIEYPPLLSDGFREIGLWQLDEWFLEPFAEKSRRRFLIDRLRAFIEKLDELNLDVELWLDGSFATLKPEPEDIDMVLFVDFSSVRLLNSIQLSQFEGIVVDRIASRNHFGCDVYFADKNDSMARQYWHDAFAYTPDQLGRKGIFKLIRHAATPNRPH